VSIVTLTDVGKRFKGKPAVSGVGLSLDAGEVLGLVGPNGSGKSTILKIVAGLMRPSEGLGEVLGQAIGPRKHPCPFIGIMAEKPAFLEHFSGPRNLRQLASVRGTIKPADIALVLRGVGLDPRDKRPVKAYSQGMRQRLSYAQAVMEHPSLLLLDEPTNGLDPEGIVEMRGFIRAIAQEGAGVILASHLLSEVEMVCDRVLMVLDGRCVREFVPEDGKVRQSVLLVVSHERQLTYEHGVPELARRLVGAGVDIEHIGLVNSSLEEIYMGELAGELR
jgi:ABC-2 type transport system ATP-binding protein